MKRQRKWTWRVARGLGIAALVVLGLWLGLGPTIIKRVIAARVEGLGLPKPSLRVVGYSLTHLEITRLSVGQTVAGQRSRSPMKGYQSHPEVIDTSTTLYRPAVADEQ